MLWDETGFSQSDFLPSLSGAPYASASRYSDLCKLPVLFLLPNRLFPEFLDCTAFIGFLKAQQSPSNLRFGNGKLDIKGNPVLNSHMDDFSFLLGETSILDDFKSTRGRNSDAFWWKKLNWEPAQVSFSLQLEKVRCSSVLRPALLRTSSCCLASGEGKTRAVQHRGVLPDAKTMVF